MVASWRWLKCVLALLLCSAIAESDIVSHSVIQRWELCGPFWVSMYRFLPWLRFQGHLLLASSMTVLAPLTALTLLFISSSTRMQQRLRRSQTHQSLQNIDCSLLSRSALQGIALSLFPSMIRHCDLQISTQQSKAQSSLPKLGDSQSLLPIVLAEGSRQITAL
jgi:hypothetical protein